MMNHPEVQRRAQSEIDSVVGSQRLPDFEDRASLPYLDAIMRETMRWHPVLPTGAFTVDGGFLDSLTYSRWTSCDYGGGHISRVLYSAR